MNRILALSLPLLLGAPPVLGETPRSTRDVVGAPVSFEYSHWPVVIAPGGWTAFSFPDTLGELLIGESPAAAVATLEVDGTHLTIRGTAPGTTTALIGDSAQPEISVTLEIRVSEPDEPPAVPTDSVCHTLVSGRSKYGCWVYVTNDGGATLSMGATFARTDALDVAGGLWTFDDHVGRMGRPLAVARYDGRLFQRDGDRWAPWNGELTTLSGTEAWRPLQPFEPVEAVSELSDLPGEFTLFIGYRVEEDAVYTAFPVRFSVAP